MATDGPTPLDCDTEIFNKGKPVVYLDGSPNAIEKWVREVAEKAGARVDWHYSGGVAQVLHLGDSESRQRVMKAIQEQPLTYNPRMMFLVPDGCNSSLHRSGVDEVPEGAIVGFMDPFSGEQQYIP